MESYASDYEFIKYIQKFIINSQSNEYPNGLNYEYGAYFPILFYYKDTYNKIKDNYKFTESAELINNHKKINSFSYDIEQYNKLAKNYTVNIFFLNQYIHPLYLDHKTKLKNQKEELKKHEEELKKNILLLEVSH